MVKALDEGESLTDEEKKQLNIFNRVIANYINMNNKLNEIK
jgi:hypothetical protein